MHILLLLTLFLAAWSWFGGALFLHNYKAAIKNNKHIQLLVISGPVTWIVVFVMHISRLIEKYFNSK